MIYLSKSVEDTYKLAYGLADTLTGGEVILLSGELGAGKTTFTKGLARALGVTEAVTSPTFTLMHQYDGGRLPVYHFDMYRIESAEEASELGFEEYIFGGGVSVIEWNKLAELFGKVIRINIKRLSDSEREFEVL